MTCHQEKPFKTRNLEVQESSTIHQKYHKKKTLPTQSSKLYMDKQSFKNGGIRYIHTQKGFPGFSEVKNQPANAGDAGSNPTTTTTRTIMYVYYICYIICVYMLYNIYMLYIYISVCVLVVQSCPTLCDSKDCSPPGSSVHGIL